MKYMEFTGVFAGMLLLASNSAYSSSHFCRMNPNAQACRGGTTAPTPQPLTVAQFQAALGVGTGSGPYSFKTNGANKVFYNVPLKGVPISSLPAGSETIQFERGKIAYFPQIQFNGSTVDFASVVFGTVTGTELVEIVSTADQSAGTIDSTFASAAAIPPPSLPKYTTTCQNAPIVQAETSAQYASSTGAALPSPIQEIIVAIFTYTSTSTDSGCTMSFPGGTPSLSSLLGFY